MKRIILALLPLLFLTGIVNNASTTINIISAGANSSGSGDVSAAFNNAIAAGATYIVVPPGQYLLNGTATIALQNVTIACQGAPPSANTPPSYGTSGATFLMTSTSVQPFTIKNNVKIIGCNFFWPNQIGTNPSPIVYPPLFTEPTGSQVTNFDLDHDRIINAYDVFDAASATDAMGGLHFTDTYGYAIRYWLSLANTPETWTITGMQADWGIYQGVAGTGNQYLAKWTGANGVFLHVFGNGNCTTTASTVGVGGLFMAASGVYGYNKFLWVDCSGDFNESIIDSGVDGAQAAMQVDAGACIADVIMHGVYYSYLSTGNGGGPGGADTNPVFSFGAPVGTCTDGGVTISGHLITAQGDVLDLSGSKWTTLSLNLTGNGSYAASSTAGTYYFANINSSSARVTATGNYLQGPSYGGSGPYPANYYTADGFNIQACGICTISDNQFNGINTPISITGTAPVVGTGNISLNDALQTITGISLASSAVVSFTDAATANPFAVGNVVWFGNVAGMTQINGMKGTVTAIGGSNPSYTATVNINSAAFTAWASGGTIGSGGVVGTGIAAHRFMQSAGNTWDLLLGPAVTSCGTGAAVVGSDVSGSITVGTGSITSCTITFGQSWSPSVPRCTFMPATNTVLWESGLSSTAITISSSANIASSQIQYSCQL